MICLPFWLRVMALVICGLGGVAGLVLSIVGGLGVSRYLLVSNLRSFCGRMWFMPGISTRGVIVPFLYGGEVYYHLGDLG